MNRLFSLGFLSIGILFSISVSSQDVVSIADGGTVSDVSCASSVIITDSNADNGNYLPDENHVITVCVEAGSLSEAEIIISPELYGDDWDVDANSTLFIYDGPNTASPLLGAFNSVTDPAGVTVSGSIPGGCMTLEFVSGSNSTGEGFTANFTCLQPLQPFLFDVVSTPEIEDFPPLTFPTVQICFGDSIILDVNTSYPLSDAGGNGYEQSDETSFFRYLMGDGTIYQGFGLTSISHTYDDPFGYLVTIIVQDVSGQVENQQVYVLIAPRPDFSNLPNNDTLCVGEQTVITGGVDEAGFIGVDPTTSAILGGGILGEQLYLPDGNDENYETSITIDEFDDDQVIENVSDIINFCVNMEHSYLGDLEMMLTCPDGTSINVFNSFTGDGLFPDGFGGGGTYLGDAFDNSTGVPGIGFDYCFSMDADFGTMGEEFANGNTVPVNTFSDGNAMAPGTYLPEESFEAFIGCPINGEWTLTIRDNLFIDDGFIFNWSIYFDPTINPSTVYYSPDIVDVFWEENDDIIANDGATITVEPSQAGNNNFTFVAVDEFGCIHDTTITVYVRPEATVSDAIACDLTHTLNPSNTPNGGTWEIITQPSENSTINFDIMDEAVADVTVDEYGIYIFEITEANCNYVDQALIDFRPDPIIDPFVSDTVLCVGGAFVLDVGPQEANSDNFNIIWTRDGSAFNNEDLAITVDETGQYIATLSGVCGSVTDTTNVVAITIEFEGQTICGLQSFGDVELNPEGEGLWSASSDGISFSSANQLFTSISSLNYGPIDITFTDTRCPNDGVSMEYIFVEQPTVAIIPENPDFCLESDTLKLVASLGGDFGDTYLWSLNGDPQPGIESSTLTFNPPSSPNNIDGHIFQPLETYLIELTVLDLYGVCPQATGSAIFDGKWCTYNVPNVVTPNGDNRNDKFNVQFMEYFPTSSIKIFNRWGQIVFENDNYASYQASTGGWDPVDDPEGTYFFELRIPTIDKIETGYIQVLKGDKAQ